MSSANNEIEMNSEDLYREEAVTDRRVGSIRILNPIKADGSEDGDRSTIFLGQAQMLTPMGAIPLSFEIQADSLSHLPGPSACGQHPMPSTLDVFGTAPPYGTRFAPPGLARDLLAHFGFLRTAKKEHGWHGRTAKFIEEL